MSIDTLVYEKKNNQARIAALASGEMRELEIVDFTTAGEGNIYLGRITRKIDWENRIFSGYRRQQRSFH